MTSAIKESSIHPFNDIKDYSCCSDETLKTITRLCRGLITLVPVTVIGTSMLAFSLASKITLAAMVCACAIGVIAGACIGAILGCLQALLLPPLAFFLCCTKNIFSLETTGKSGKALALKMPEIFPKEFTLQEDCANVKYYVLLSTIVSCCIFTFLSEQIAGAVELPHYGTMCLFWPLAHSLARDWDLAKKDQIQAIKAPSFFVKDQKGTPIDSAYKKAISPLLPIWQNDTIQASWDLFLRVVQNPYAPPS